MKRIFLDFETYYDDEYTLRHSTPIEYVLDERWEMIGCGVAVDNDPPRFMPQIKVIEWLRTLTEPYTVITHNALFDATILAWRYAIHPAILIDTMGMARAMLAHATKRSSVSLETILAHYGMPPKLTTIKDVKGKRFFDIVQDRDLLLMFTTYNIRDVNGCRDIYNNLISDFPVAELRVMDRLIRMVTQPQLLLDRANLRTYYATVMHEKETLLNKLGHDKAKYMSAEQFAELLREEGVEPPRKISPTTGKWIYAFAKSDADFQALREHESETVQALVAARLGLKSTIEETRTHTFINIGDLSAKHYVHPWLPVPLKYSGAHTHRFSGDWKLNMQNLSSRKTKALRSCIQAPGGEILAVDASQIEARLTAWLAGQTNLLEQFADPTNDVYAWFGSQIYGQVITKASHPVERFNSKTIVLGLGFGMSAAKLLVTLKNSAPDAGIDPKIYNLEQCQEWVGQYRNIFPNIPHFWRICDWVISKMIDPTMPGGGLHTLGPCKIDGTTIILPSGLRLYYDNLQYDGSETTYTYGSMKRKIYGAKMTENIVQALDRQHVIEANMRTEDRCRRELGLDIRLAMQVHDENVYVVPWGSLSTVKAIALEEMCRSPVWAPDIPLAAEAHIGRNYGELK